MNLRDTMSAVGPARRLAFRVLVAATLIATGASAQVLPGGGTFGSGTRPGGVEDEAFLRHVLNRLTYGPTEESWAEIRAIGADAFIERQLHPEWIDDSALEQKLAADIVPWTVGPDPLDPTAPYYDWYEFYYQYTTRAVQSKRQLQEIMTEFWENHFDTVVPRGNDDVQRYEWTQTEDREDRLFRQNALGRFRDLFELSAKSTAMMYFLDNYRNTVREGNENYAREMMELHSLGVDCGYDQTDVEQVALIMTGWTGCYLVRGGDCTGAGLIREDLDGDGNPDFVFQQAAHDYTQKVTLGSVFPDPANPTEAGLGEGMRVLDILSRHPCTARFISRKLLEVFVTDEPSDDLVDRIADVFLKTDGDIRRVLRAIFHTPEFHDPANFGNKVKTPLEFTVSSVRALGAQVLIADPARPEGSYVELYNRISVQGMPLFDQSIPTGYAERAPSWISANGFLQRWKYAERVAYLLSNPAGPVYYDPMAQTAQLQLVTADAVIDHYSRIILGKTLDDTRRALMRDVLVAGNPSGDFEPGRASQGYQLRQMLSQMLGFPEFNKQ